MPLVTPDKPEWQIPAVWTGNIDPVQMQAEPFEVKNDSSAQSQKEEDIAQRDAREEGFEDAVIECLEKINEIEDRINDSNEAPRMEEVAIGWSPQEDSTDSTLRGAGDETIPDTEHKLDVGPGKEAFVNPDELLGEQALAGDLPGIGAPGIAELSGELSLEAVQGILFGAGGRTRDISDVLPEQATPGKDPQDLMDAGGSVGDPRLSTGPPIPYPNIGKPTTGSSSSSSSGGFKTSKADNSGASSGPASHKTGPKRTQPKLKSPFAKPAQSPSTDSDDKDKKPEKPEDPPPETPPTEDPPAREPTS